MLKVFVGAHVYSLCNPWSHTIGFIEKNSYKKKKLIKVGAKKKIAIIINEFPSQGKPFFFSCLLTVRNVSSHYPFDSCLSLWRQDRQWQLIS